MDDLSSDDDVLKEKSNNGKSQGANSSMGFGKGIKGRRGEYGHDDVTEISWKAAQVLCLGLEVELIDFRNESLISSYFDNQLIVSSVKKKRDSRVPASSS